MTEEKRGLSLSEVLRQLEDTHGHLIDFVRRTSEGQFTRDTRFRRRLRLDTYSHSPQHAEAIRKWRAQRPRGLRPHTCYPPPGSTPPSDWPPPPRVSAPEPASPRL